MSQATLDSSILQPQDPLDSYRLPLQNLLSGLKMLSRSQPLPPELCTQLYVEAGSDGKGTFYHVTELNPWNPMVEGENQLPNIAL